MTDASTAETMPATDPAEVRRFLQTFTALVKSATAGLVDPGLLQLGRVHPLDKGYVPTRYKIDD